MPLRNEPITNKKKLIFVIVAFMLVGASLYWLSVRSYIASKSCHRIALDNSGYTNDNSGAWMRNDSAQRDYMFVYELCMHKEGIST